ncbi:IclR family transcriptional regulator [Advenella sp. WQ 585]|uniref:IclR family transcriptional regulator n=1 Tax=Advenella mandrilli TaxID=2800330 RepID=A0ABS1EA09_9BURK|nr:IclR family transcriptional regulator [Advenella mandrilli]MBK1780637.1 IclR family transcriptional regulator [Advenella mandrilli]
MSEKSPSSLARMLMVLDFFTEDTPIWSVEDIAQKLEVSIPTCYRYMKMLVESGWLTHQSESCYTFGPRILVMDYYVRQSDPVLRASVPHMQELVAKTGFACVLSAFYGDRVLDSHHEKSDGKTFLSYGRGMPRPLFQGGAPKVILAHLPPRQLRKIYDGHAHELKKSGVPEDWSSFRAYYQQIKKQGFYYSAGELESHLGALSVPIEKVGQPGVWGALSLVAELSRFEVVDAQKMKQLLEVAIRSISQSLV